MANGTIIINGVSYLTQRPVQCDSVGEEPDKAFVDSYVSLGGLETNLVSDILFYLPDAQKLCRAAVLNTLPEKGELKLDQFPQAKILYKQSEHHQAVSSVEVKSGDKEIDKKMVKILEKYDIAERKWIDLNKLERFKEDLFKFAAGFKKIIDIKIIEDPEDKDKVKVILTLRDIPKTVEVIPTTEDALTLDESAIIGAVVQELVDVLPAAAIGMYYNSIDLATILSKSDVMKALDVTPILNNATIEGDKLVVRIDVQKGMPTIKAAWSREFQEYNYTRSDAERAEAAQELAKIEKTLSEAKNRSELIDKQDLIKKQFLDGWMEGKRNYLITFKEVPSPEDSSVLTLEINKVPIPTKMIVEGDYPSEDKPAIDTFLQPSMDKGKVDISKVEEALPKIQAYYESKGMKIKELKYTITQDGILYVTLVLRRWDAVSFIEVENSGGTPKDKAEQIALMNEIMAPLQGKFITQEDINGLKKKFSRGFSRSDVEIIIATEAETGRTRVVFMASEGKSQEEYSGGGSASSAGLFLMADVQIADNGHGTSYGISGALFTKWKAFESRSISDIYYESLKLNWATSVSPNSSVSVGIYEWIKNYEGINQQTYGAEAYYHQYFLNDALTLSTGGAIELIRHSDDVEGYTDFPVRVKLSANVCYAKNGLKVCVKNGGSVGAANYGKSSVSLSYAIPIGDSENAPFVQFKAVGGIEYGKVPLLEQFNNLDLGLPFGMSLLDGTINFSKYYAGASVELVQIINEWFGIKPIVATIRTIGDHASVTTGSCLFALGMQVCVGYAQNINNTKSGLAISIEPAGEMNVPQPLKSIISNYLLGTRLGDPNK